MKAKLDGLLQHYVASLRKHLKQESHASLQAASRMGREVVAFGLETVELVRIHERALILLEPFVRKTGLATRAENFFIKAITPIMETHCAASATKNTLDRLNNMASRRAARLATANRQLQRSIVRFKARENAFQKSGKHKDKFLGESLQQQKHLRKLTHRVLGAQEDERKKISHELQDEIAQNLLGINVRLLSLKEKARSSPKGLKKEIASTRRLVAKSAKSMRWFAHEIDNYQQHEVIGLSKRP
jgi:signal transduction histidine kinase